jgi:hypothetical protein
MATDSNSARFHLSVESGTALAVVDFRLLEGICGGDWCEVRAVGAPGLELEGESASLEFEGEHFHGSVVSQEVQTVEGKSVYHLRLETLLFQLNGEPGFSEHHGESYRSVVKGVCEFAQVNANGSASLLARHNETALEFLRRVEAQGKLFDFVRHSESRAELIVSEDDSVFQTVPYDPSQASAERYSKRKLSARTHSPALRPGSAFEAHGHEFVVASAAHHGSLEGGYANHIAALSRGLPIPSPAAPLPALDSVCVSRADDGTLVLRTKEKLRLECDAQMEMQGQRIKIVGDLVEIN